MYRLKSFGDRTVHERDESITEEYVFLQYMYATFCHHGHPVLGLRNLKKFLLVYFLLATRLDILSAI